MYLLDPSDAFLEGTVPVKLPIRHVPYSPLFLGGRYRLVRLRFVEVSHLRLLPVFGGAEDGNKLPHTCDKW